MVGAVSHRESSPVVGAAQRWAWLPAQQAAQMSTRMETLSRQGVWLPGVDDGLAKGPDTTTKASGGSLVRMVVQMKAVFGLRVGGEVGAAPGWTPRKQDEPMDRAVVFPASPAPEPGLPQEPRPRLSAPPYLRGLLAVALHKPYRGVQPGSHSVSGTSVAPLPESGLPQEPHSRPSSLL